MKIVLLLALLPLLFAFVIPKPYKRYIEQHKHKAQMLHHSTGVPVSIQFAQAIYESRGGRSPLAKKTNNHFGISCGDNWHGQRYYSNRCWRKYKTVGESY